MDDQQALAIVTALANGANPQTGELFPADSPYQSPEVIRALFAAQRALESKPGSKGELRSSASRASIGAAPADAKRPAVGNAGKQWSDAEDKQLLAAFDVSTPIADIARAHGRTVGGVRARLEKHGRLEPSPATRWPQRSDATSARRPTN